MGYAARRFTTLLDLRGWACFLGLGLVLVLGMPLLNGAVPQASAFAPRPIISSRSSANISATRFLPSPSTWSGAMPAS